MSKKITKPAAKATAAKAEAKQGDNIQELSLRAALSAIESKHGKGSVMLSGVTEMADVEFVATDHLDLDDLMGGGLPRGRIIEVYGDPSTGKSTLALDFCRAMQQSGERAAYVDVEHALDPDYAEALGVDMASLLVSQPDSAEQALDITEMLVKSGAVGIVVVDSVAALVTRAELEGEVGDRHVAELARLMSQTLKKLIAATYKTKCVLVFCNQERSNIAPGGYGPTRNTSGGRSLPFYASIRLETRLKEKIKKGQDGDFIGQLTMVKCVKNKVGIPHRRAEVQIDYPNSGRAGLNRTAPILDRALDSGIVKQNKAWFSMDDKNIAQGRPNMLALLDKDSDLKKKLLEGIK